MSNTDVFDPCKILKMGPLGVNQNVRGPQQLACSLPAELSVSSDLPLNASQAVITGCGCNAPKAAPPTSGKAYSSGSLAALGIILPLFTLGIGACVGVCIERKTGGARRAKSGGHQRLEEDEVALTERH